MAKGKSQQSQAQPQKKGGPQQNSRQTRDKPSRGCCGCIFSLIRKLIVLIAVTSLLYVVTFTGYHYHAKGRVPTVDEFKAYSTELYLYGSQRGAEYYAVADKHAKVYYAHFEKEHLPTIQLYTKKYTKLAVEKAGDLKELSVKYFAIVQKQVEIYYKLALKKIEEFQSGKSAPPTAAPTAAPKRATESKPTTPKPTTAAPTTAAPTTPKPTQAPQTPPPTTQKAATPKPVPTTPKPTEAPKKAAPSSKEKKEL